MSAPAPLRAVAFADAHAQSWGLLLQLADRALATVCATGGLGRTLPVEIEDRADGRWAAQGADLALEVEPLGSADTSPPEGASLLRCRLAGTLPRAPADGATAGAAAGASAGEKSGGEGELLGAQTIVPAFEPSALGATRLVTASFADGPSYALCAQRPRRGKGHDREVVEARLLDREASVPLEDPRLSSAYTSEGELLRMGLELWQPVADEEQEGQLPHRVAGEVDGEPQRAELDSLDVAVWRLRCHGRGREGWGLYTLLRSR